jgi:hypothetical protein
MKAYFNDMTLEMNLFYSEVYKIKETYMYGCYMSFLTLLCFGSFSCLYILCLHVSPYNSSQVKLSRMRFMAPGHHILYLNE